MAQAFLWTGCPPHHPTNSVKALEELNQWPGLILSILLKFYLCQHCNTSSTLTITATEYMTDNICIKYTKQNVNGGYALKCCLVLPSQLNMAIPLQVLASKGWLAD